MTRGVQQLSPISNFINQFKFYEQIIILFQD